MNAAIIKNRDRLETTEFRRKALDIAEAGIGSVLPARIIQSALTFDLPATTLSVFRERYKYRRLFVIGAGKASGLMAEAVEKIVGPNAITSGLIIEKAPPAEFNVNKIRIVQAGHPLPDRRGIAAACELLGLKTKFSISGDDLILCLISGGGSALMPGPLDGILLEDKQLVTNQLLSCGADIREINIVRKHLSRTKGGRLAEYFAPARVISLILSDVIGNDLGVIASGPTFPDASTFSEAYAILKKYQLLDKVPTAILDTLGQGCRGAIPETPKSLDNIHNYIIGDVKIALEGMAEKARQLGFNPLIITAEQRGDTGAAAACRAKEIMNGNYTGYSALLIGGETTPVLPVVHGRGGRNQHYAVCTLAGLSGWRRQWVLTSLGTDGSDFIPEAAGAIVDERTLDFFKGREFEIRRSIEGYDSYRLLNMTGNSLIITGNTHTNVGDIILYLLK